MKQERTIIFTDGEETLFINTNAPKELIEKAIMFRGDVLAEEVEYFEEEDYEEYDGLCDFEIIQCFINDKGYSFDLAENLEEYEW